VEALARITAKGQVTVPKSVRDALGLRQGDTLVFRVEGDHAVVAAASNLTDLAGVVRVPVEVGGMTWGEVRRRAWKARGQEVAR
jgi:antitoxin PrlF